MPESSVDIRDVLVGLRKMERASTSDAGLFWRELKVEAREEIRSHRRGQQSRRTKSKRNSKGRFIASKSKRKRGPVLGKLLTAYKIFTDSSGLTMRHHVDWGLVHHEGGTVGNKAKIPARPFAYFGNPFVTSTANSYAAFGVAQGWAK